MIKANELRIGNYVFDKLKQCLIKIHSANGISNVESNPNEYNPVEITEEMLLKLGFDKKNNGELINSGYSITFSTFGYPHFWISEFSYIIILYIHELQNLYFALTGSELFFSTEP